MWETKINPTKIFELRGKNTTYFGIGSIKKIEDILEALKHKGIDNVIFITGKNSYRVSGAWDVIEPALNTLGFKYSLYDKVGPNPTVDMIDEAANLAGKLGRRLLSALAVEVL